MSEDIKKIEGPAPDNPRYTQNDRDAFVAIMEGELVPSLGGGKPKRSPYAASRLRHSRGYNFEYNLVNKFLDLDDWTALRLGGSTVELPDIVAINNKRGILVAIECKSGEANTLWIPDDQIERCRKAMRYFIYYPFKFFVPAYKFKGIRKKRKLSYRFGVFNFEESEQFVGAMSYNFNEDRLSGTLVGELHGTQRTAPLSYKGLATFEEVIAVINGYVDGAEKEKEKEKKL